MIAPRVGQQRMQRAVEPGLIKRCGFHQTGIVLLNIAGITAVLGHDRGPLTEPEIENCLDAGATQSSGEAIATSPLEGDLIVFDSTATDLDPLDPDEARHRIAVSYDTVRAGLKKSERDALPPREAN